MAIKELLISQIRSLERSQSEKQQMNKMTANFGNKTLISGLKVKISILEKENLDLKNQPIDKHMTMQRLQTGIYSTNLKESSQPFIIT